MYPICLWHHFPTSSIHLRVPVLVLVPNSRSSMLRVPVLVIGTACCSITRETARYARSLVRMSVSKFVINYSLFIPTQSLFPISFPGYPGPGGSKNIFLLITVLADLSRVRQQSWSSQLMPCTSRNHPASLIRNVPNFSESSKALRYSSKKSLHSEVRSFITSRRDPLESKQYHEIARLSARPKERPCGA